MAKSAPKKLAGGYDGPTYKVAPPDYVCNTCGFRHPVGRENNMGGTEGAPTMLRHLQDEHGYQPKHPIRDWREYVEIPQQRSA